MNQYPDKGKLQVSVSAKDNLYPILQELQSVYQIYQPGEVVDGIPHRFFGPNARL